MILTVILFAVFYGGIAIGYLLGKRTGRIEGMGAGYLEAHREMRAHLSRNGLVFDHVTAQRQAAREGRQ